MRYILKVIEWSDVSTNNETEVEIYADSYDDIEDIAEEQYPDLMAYEVIKGV